MSKNEAIFIVIFTILFFISVPRILFNKDFEKESDNDDDESNDNTNDRINTDIVK